MPRYKTRAVVLKRFNYSNTSRIVSLYTLDVGLVKVMARGARRPKSAYGASLEIATEINCEIYVKTSRDIQSLIGTDIENSHDLLRASAESFAYGCVLLEAVNITSYPLQTYKELYRYISISLNEMEHANGGEYRMLLWRHLMGFFIIQGYGPVLDRCVYCGGEVKGTTLSYLPGEGGITCGCRENNYKMAVNLSRGSLKLLTSISSCPLTTMKNYRPWKTQIEEIEKLLMSILSYQTGRNIHLRTLKFINSINQK